MPSVGAARSSVVERYRRAARLAVAVLGFTGLARVSHAQSPDVAPKDTSTLADVGAGSVAQRLTAKFDPRFHYAAYVPPGYRQSAPAPLLILMDARGRAMVPLTIVRGIAARVGWIVLSSYETASADSTDSCRGKTRLRWVISKTCLTRPFSRQIRSSPPFSRNILPTVIKHRSPMLLTYARSPRSTTRLVIPSEMQDSQSR